MKRRRGIFYGWWIVAASFGLIAYGGGAYWYGFSVFFKPIQNEFGWTRAETSAAFSLASLEGGVQGPIVGPLVDRFGPRRLMLLGTIVMGLGFVALGYIQSLWAFYLVYVALLALGSNTATGIAPVAAVAHWFVRRRSLAFAILSAGWSLGGGVMVPFLAWLIPELSWRTAAIFVGVTVWLMGLPLSLLVRHKPEPYGYLPDGDPDAALSLASSKSVTPADPVNFTLRQALRSRALWFLALSFTARTLALSAIVVHQVALLIDRGFDPQMAANLLGLTAFMGVPGRLIFGYLGDRYTKRYLLTVTYVIMAGGLFLLISATSETQVILYALSFGLAAGIVPLTMAIQAEYFGTRAFAAINGTMGAITAIGTVGGPVFAGWIFDVTKSYESAITLIAIVSLMGALCALLASPPRPPAKLGPAA